MQYKKCTYRMYTVFGLFGPVVLPIGMLFLVEHFDTWYLAGLMTSYIFIFQQILLKISRPLILNYFKPLLKLYPM